MGIGKKMLSMDSGGHLKRSLEPRSREQGNNKIAEEISGCDRVEDKTLKGFKAMKGQSIKWSLLCMSNHQE